ncbi:MULTISPECIES: hypothetical protein [Okeania]|uniref:hypothetical protein n=1 Tax=Okeania TaxID=1458928 RepID=UPI000F5417CE|nr:MULTISPECIES: hypothetical protein [Okeania]NET15216.1 hypothetical protein [Okeania sp. SIO1H6]NET19204.1 hypothetical protein [Okeania sp. SIO1H5]NET93524.1 hypothetical protein [Okeania sp. SIO1H2]RQH16759.1 hypothetical protein D4Z78_19610 [Okeania hirsuta]
MPVASLSKFIDFNYIFVYFCYNVLTKYIKLSLDELNFTALKNLEEGKRKKEKVDGDSNPNQLSTLCRPGDSQPTKKKINHQK